MGCIIRLGCCLAQEIASSNGNNPPQTPSSQLPAHSPTPYCHCRQCVYVFREYHAAQQIELQRQENKAIAEAGGSVAGNVAGTIVSEFIPFGGLVGSLISKGAEKAAEKATEKATEKVIESALNDRDERRRTTQQSQMDENTTINFET